MHAASDNTFDNMYLVVDKRPAYSQTGKDVPTQLVETGHMLFASSDKESSDYSFLADFYYSGDVLEIRIPWGLLDFSAPY